MAQGRRFATTLVLIRTFRRIASNATTADATRRQDDDPQVTGPDVSSPPTIQDTHLVPPQLKTELPQ
jgi:hypothetical protein